MTTELEQTSRTTISRHSSAAVTIAMWANAILDEGMVAHVGFDSDAGHGVAVIPMTYARLGDEIVLARR